MSKGNGRPPHRRGPGGPQGPRSMEVRVQIPKVPGVSQEALAGMVRMQMAEIQPWAPLTEPQTLADAAARVVGDLPAMQQILTGLLDSPVGTRWSMTLLQPMQITIGEPLAKVLLTLEAPTRLSECHSVDQIASFLTMAGYLTSGTMRGLATLQGCFARFELLGPATTTPASDTPSEEGS